MIWQDFQRWSGEPSNIPRAGNNKTDESLENSQLNWALSILTQILVFGNIFFSNATSCLAPVTRCNRCLHAMSKEGITLHRGSALHESLCSSPSCCLFVSLAHICCCASDPLFPACTKDGEHVSALKRPFYSLWASVAFFGRLMETNAYFMQILVFLFHHFQLDTNADFILGHFYLFIFYLCVWRTAACLSLRVNISSAKLGKSYY